MRIRFSIRDLLWLTLLCAVLVAWFLHWQQYVDYEEKALEYDRIQRAFKEAKKEFDKLPTMEEVQKAIDEGRPLPSFPPPPTNSP